MYVFKKIVLNLNEGVMELMGGTTLKKKKN